MHKTFSRVFVSLAALAAISGSMALAAHNSTARVIPGTSPGEAIACRVLEIHAGASVVLVIFHQRDAQRRDALAEFLQAHADKAVQFQTADGTWHDATVFRLKSCFGRGLLVIPAAAARLNEKDTFALRAAAP